MAGNAKLYIYGEITSGSADNPECVNAAKVLKQLTEFDGVKEIEVHINSYGGEVAEGLAIYNALRKHSAKITTYCDGFACSIASVIFMAGDNRIMNAASLLMIHNAWTCAAGNAAELRKQANDLEKITLASIEAYKNRSNLDENEIKELMNGETWITPEDAVKYGFATEIDENKSKNANQNAFNNLFEIVKAYQAEKTEQEPEEPTPEEAEEPETETEDTETEDAETEEPETDGEETEPETEETKEKASQHWTGFFNAILK